MQYVTYKIFRCLACSRVCPVICMIPPNLNGGPMARGKDDDAITIAFRLPRRMHERLKAAAGEESNVSEEIRRRLELTLKIADEAAEEVVDGIAYVSGMLTIEGRWWINPFLHQVMVEAANQLLLPSKPKEPPS